jgi:hypothetical protein
MSVTIATPHESDSFPGSYKPWASGKAEKSIETGLHSPEFRYQGLHRPVDPVYQRR